MAVSATASPSPRPSSFASLLTGFASPAAKLSSSVPSSVDDGLEDDIATISYEQALRTHARGRSTHPSGPPPGSVDASGTSQRKPPASVPITEWQPQAQAPPVTVPTLSNSLEARRKSASITIRLSPSECAQLHGRAAAAELTVSAYLRSCVFEAESLRAQVKEALAQLRPADLLGAATAASSPAPGNSTLQPTWRSRLLPPWKRATSQTA